MKIGLSKEQTGSSKFDASALIYGSPSKKERYVFAFETDDRKYCELHGKPLISELVPVFSDRIGNILTTVLRKAPHGRLAANAGCSVAKREDCVRVNRCSDCVAISEAFFHFSQAEINVMAQAP
ncbi:MAG TPA: hypothetical protein VGR78_12645 [Verrucomicrobiae bacterium]|jgi:hypothetical protein|nr:hypothetical protein [Verrucomicrobiae bacterium]